MKSVISLLSALYSFLILLLPFSFLFLSCEKTTAPVNKLQLTLSAEYVGVTEADLRLQTKNNEANTQYQLFRDDSLISDGALIQAETLISTLDTTSHDFNWDILTIGIYPSRLYDVAIINENDIWAVGEIYADSTQPSFRYNAVHWECAQWRLQRITVRFRDSDITPPGEGIFVFSNSDIWVTLGGAPAHWDGSNWTLYHLWDMGVLTQNDGGVTRIWGSLPDNVYFAGRGGTIVHYNGGSWQKLENPAGAGGTDFDFQDIWGEVDLSNGQNKILAVACNRFTNDGSAVVRITGNTINLVQGAGLPSNISGVWSADGREWYICGDGLFKSRDLTKPWQEIAGQPLIYKLCIRGNGPNDIFVAGYLGLVSHWNGYSWQTYPAMPGNYYGLAVQGDLVVAVGQETAGWVGGPATILMGRRNS
jgi:hypothetical protein